MNSRFCHIRGQDNNVTHSKHLILYPLRLKPLFPNDNITLRPKVDLWPNLIKSWLKKSFLENKTYFGKEKLQETLSMCTQTYGCMPCVHILTQCARIPHVWARI